LGEALSRKAVWWDLRLASLLTHFFVCTVTDYSAAEKDIGMKLRMLVRLLSKQVFSHFSELWFSWSYGGGITSGMSYRNRSGAVGIGRRDSVCSRNWGRPSRNWPYGCLLTQKKLHRDKEPQMLFTGDPNTLIATPRWRTAVILEQSKIVHISGTVCPITARYGTVTRVLTLLTFTLLEVHILKIQDGDGLLALHAPKKFPQFENPIRRRPPSRTTAQHCS